VYTVNAIENTSSNKIIFFAGSIIQPFHYLFILQNTASQYHHTIEVFVRVLFNI